MNILRKNSSENDYNYYLDVTKYMKLLFGNILVKAELLINDYNTKEEAEEIAIRKIKSFQNNKNSFDIDADIIIFHFKNGNIVEIGNSEWGWISSKKLKADNINNSLECITDDELRKAYISIIDYTDNNVEIKNKSIITMAYLKYPEHLNDALLLFRKDLEKEIIERFLYLN